MNLEQKSIGVFKETDPFQSITYSISTSNKNCVGRWKVLALDN